MIKDFQFNLNEYNKAEEVHGKEALVFAIRNLLLTRPGNYPFTPGFGMNIEKYNFDLADSQTLTSIKSEMLQQIADYFPSLADVTVNVGLESDSENENKKYLTISVSSVIDSEKVTQNFLIYANENNDVSILNEAY